MFLLVTILVDEVIYHAKTIFTQLTHLQWNTNNVTLNTKYAQFKTKYIHLNSSVETLSAAYVLQLVRPPPFELETFRLLNLATQQTVFFRAVTSE